MLRRKRFAKNQSKPLSPSVQDAISGVLAARTERVNGVKYIAKPVGSVAGIMKLAGELAENSQIRGALVRTLLSAGIFGALSAGLVYKLSSRKITVATKKLSGIIAEECMVNNDLRGFIFRQKYLYIDKRGEITASRINPNKVGFGYFRIDVADIRKIYTKLLVDRYPPRLED